MTWASAYFKKNGSLVYHLSYGYEKDVPAEIRRLVNNTYTGYAISRAILVKAQNRNIWVVNLEGLKRWVIISIEDGELQEVKNFEKGWNLPLSIKGLGNQSFFYALYWSLSAAWV